MVLSFGGQANFGPVHPIKIVWNNSFGKLTFIHISKSTLFFFAARKLCGPFGVLRGAFEGETRIGLLQQIRHQSTPGHPTRVEVRITTHL
jgi:hypothetical protein